MTQGLKKLIPIVIKTIPEIAINREWLAKHVDQSKHIGDLAKAGFNVLAVVADNYSSNVSVLII